MIEKTLIGGRLVAPTGSESIPVHDSTSEEVLGVVKSASDTDVDAAVSAARAAQPEWEAAGLEARLDALQSIADALETHADGLTDLLTREVGQAYAIARDAQVREPIELLRDIRRHGEAVQWSERVGSSDVVRAAVGVVAAITPWNYPLSILVGKVAPALAAGCAVVVKPTEIAPLDALTFADAVVESRLPPGVVNIVTGTGADVGAKLVSHPGVDMISLTGSTAAGIEVAAIAARTLKRVHLELGGKSGCIILDGADLQLALRSALSSCFTNSGQICTAQSRILVPAHRLREAEEIAAAIVASTRVGDPFDPDTELGPLASSAQRDRVDRYIRVGVEEGARVVAGGPGRPDGMERGFYVKPTVFSSAVTSMRIAQEEIFGPVSVLLGFDGEDQAVKIANGTRYGLSGAVWAAGDDHAIEVASRVRTGEVLINGGRPTDATPFEGVKQSGYGVEGGRHGVEAFLAHKTLHRREA